MFSWGHSTGTSNAGGYGNGAGTATMPAPTAGTATVSRITRSQHLESYINHPTLKPSTRRTSRKDDSTYDTVFQTKRGNTLILRVHLSMDNNTPRMVLIGTRVDHPWIHPQSHSVVGFPPISSDLIWASSGLTLGEAVSKVIVHLQLHPPIVLEITDTYLKQMQPPDPKDNYHPNNKNNHTDAPPSYGFVHSNSHHSNPDSDKDDDDVSIDFEFEVPTTFPTLETMPQKEVTHLLNNEQAFEEYASILPAKSALLEFQSDLKTDNETTANETLAQKDSLDQLVKEVQELETSYSEKMKQYESLKRTQNQLSKPQDLRDIRNKLMKAKKIAYDKSEKFANSWVDQDLDLSVQDFVESFLDQRRVFHERAAKIELLNSK